LSVELRYRILQDAREMLMARWTRQCRTAASIAERAGLLDQPIEVPLPSSQEITDLAEEFYTFVEKGAKQA